MKTLKHLKQILKDIYCNITGQCDETQTDCCCCCCGTDVCCCDDSCTCNCDK